MWRSLAKYARQQIVQSESSQVESILELWYLRLLALTKLGLCQLASAEFEKLGDFERPELCDPNTQESLVPFELRVLFATLPVHLKYPTVALERITLLIVYCKRMQIKKNKATSSNSNKGDNGDIWEQRELQMYLVLATHLVHMKDFTAAAEVLSRVSKRAPDDLDILYSLGQLYLQMGDLKSASKVFQQAQNKYNNASNNDEQMGSSSEMKATDINKTFESIAQGNWSKARDSLETMNQHNDNPTMVNNLAVCELYLGNLSKAIKIIEDLILKHPASAGICETTLMNLCTLYELRYENSNQKKLELLKQVAAWVGDSFQPTCLKLQ
ncbi:hypothetical protein BDF20DRAFT_907666 [Mycotypha africana]|uniref:uncharacterized protein n=1 Tax=Mycotypha africana TaxID=64632 RepID=UPI0023009099|nr:uncharacterized protein BDF20DRAFT_907666 [Mycotypha africana]KAI8970276.1 hypothetical protein BDF20DRAFT_907666 [Mycotypha africana]